MTKLIILITVLALCNAEELPEYKAGTLISGPGIKSRGTVVSPADQCIGKAPGQYCSVNDCDSIVTCSASGASEFLCSQLNSKNKYCVRNACSPTMDSSVACKAQSFACNAVGYLPDPTNCAIYYYCNGINGDAWQYDCGTGYAFDITTSGCKRRSSSSDCATMICRTPFQVIPYSKDITIYTRCINSVPNVYRCTDDLYETVNVTTGLCEVFCKEAGNQVNRRNCKKYYYCYKSGTKLVYQEYTCPDVTATAMWFDPVRKSCQPDTVGCLPELA